MGSKYQHLLMNNNAISYKFKLNREKKKKKIKDNYFFIKDVKWGKIKSNESPFPINTCPKCRSLLYAENSAKLTYPGKKREKKCTLFAYRINQQIKPPVKILLFPSRKVPLVPPLMLYRMIELHDFVVISSRAVQDNSHILLLCRSIGYSGKLKNIR